MYFLKFFCVIFLLQPRDTDSIILDIKWLPFLTKNKRDMPLKYADGKYNFLENLFWKIG